MNEIKVEGLRSISKESGMKTRNLKKIKDENIVCSKKNYMNQNQNMIILEELKAYLSLPVYIRKEQWVKVSNHQTSISYISNAMGLYSRRPFFKRPKVFNRDYINSSIKAN